MKRLIPIILALACIAPAARGSFAVYTNRAAFQAASPDLHTIDFTGLAGSQGYFGLGLTGNIDGVTFSTTTAYPAQPVLGSLGIMDPRFYGSQWSCNSGEYLFNSGGSSGIYIALPPGTTAFGADFFNKSYLTVGGWAGSVLATVSITGGANYQFTARTSPNSTFWGFTSDTPVAGLLYDTSDWGYYGTHNGSIDNVSFSVIPESSSAVLLLLGAGLLSVFSQPGGCRQRRDGASVSYRES